MSRERALKVVLMLVGLLFSAGIYPLTMSLWKVKESDYGETKSGDEIRGRRDVPHFRCGCGWPTFFHNTHVTSNLASPI